jgi:hypothetical protein
MVVGEEPLPIDDRRAWAVALGVGNEWDKTGACDHTQTLRRVRRRCPTPQGLKPSRTRWCAARLSRALTQSMSFSATCEAVPLTERIFPH